MRNNLPTKEMLDVGQISPYPTLVVVIQEQVNEGMNESMNE